MTTEYDDAARLGGQAGQPGQGWQRTYRYGVRRDPADRFGPIDEAPAPSEQSPNQQSSSEQGPHQQSPGQDGAAREPIFAQTPGALDWLIGPALAEHPHSDDAFTVRVTVPGGGAGQGAGAASGPLPVILFVPGGAFISGAGAVRWYDAERLAAEAGAVVVTVNYRVGLPGLASRTGASTNNCVHDVLTALRWVHRHAAALGGDPERITLLGQSAGAYLAFLLAQLPQARGLVRRAALISLPYEPPLTSAGWAERQAIIERELGIELPNADLNRVAPGELLAVQGAIGRAFAGRGLGLMPVADDVVPADACEPAATAARLHVDALLLTTNQDEAAAFLAALPAEAVSDQMLAGYLGAHFENESPESSATEHLDRVLEGEGNHAKFVEAMTLHQHRLYAEELAAAVTDAGIAVWTARFAVRSPLPGAGSPHCFELPFLFGNPEQWVDAPMLAGLDAEVIERAGAELRAVVLGFAAGDPGPAPATADGHTLAAHASHPAGVHTITAIGTRTTAVESSLRPIRGRQ